MNANANNEHAQRMHNMMPWIYWGLAAFFFFSEYFVRVSTSVMANDLMRDFQVGALALGSLSAAFYYAYLGMQIPVGVLVDKYGPRILLSMATALTAIGCYIFSIADGVSLASFARFIIGFGGAFAFVSALKLATMWLPQRYLATVVGVTQALGMLGAWVGEAPMELSVHAIGWRATMMYSAVLFAILTVIMFTVIRNREAPKESQHTGNVSVSIWNSLKIVLSNKQTWVNACYCGFIYAPTAAFAELWGVNYLHNVSHLSISAAATAIGMIFVGWTFGGPAIGWFSDKIKKRRPVMLISTLLCMISLVAVLYFDSAPFWLIATLMAVYGFFNAGLIPGYTVAAEVNPKPLAGVALGFTNMASVIIGASLQPVIGAMLELQWDGKIIDGTPIYSAVSYQNAFLVLPVSFVFAIICVYFIKETHGQPRVPVATQQRLESALQAS